MPRRDQRDEALAQILELAQTALAPEIDIGEGGDEGGDEGGNGDGEYATGSMIACTPRALPARLQLDAAELARRINPVNAPVVGAAAGIFGAAPTDPMHIAVLTSKYWGPLPRTLTVSFMEATAPALRDRILTHMNAWSARCGIRFRFTAGVGQVRISRGPGGYWSYLGTDILLIPRNRPTMNLQSFSLGTPESEYRRVVRHETGHTLGAPHEHMRKALVDRIDREKAYAYFWQTQGWNRAMVDQQVLTPLNEASLLRTPANQDSIMCYQIPGSITRDGLPIRGGRDIIESDFAFMGTIYPRAGAAPTAAPEYVAAEPAPAMAETPFARGATGGIEDWDPAEDVAPDDVEIPA